MIQDATSRFVSALKDRGLKIKGAGLNSYRAQCPAHGGEGPNLAIAKGDQGVLIKCWSHGCAEVDIAAALGLTLGDLFDQDGRAIYKMGAHQVIRTRIPKGKDIRQVNTPAVTALYVPEESLPIALCKVVLIGEGEKTADALVRIGAQCAVTWPGGSSSVGKVDLSPLAGKEVIIVPDNDEPGAKAAAILAGRLEGIAQSIRLWGVPEYHDGHHLNDAADLYLSGGTLDNLIEYEVPQPVAPNDPIDEQFEYEVQQAVFRDRVRDEARKRSEDGRRGIVSDSLKPKPLGEILDADDTHDWLIPGLLERQDRLVITGYEGSGKSWLLRQMVIAMAAGVHPLEKNNRTRPLKTLVIDAENTERQWSRGTRYIAALAERLGTASPRTGVTVAAGVRLDISKPADMNQVRRLVDKIKPDVLYIGPLYKLVDHAITNDDDAAPLIMALDELRERGICLLMEAHAGHAKGMGGARDLRPRGSAALLGWPEFGFGLEPLEDDDTMARFIPWRGQREARDFPRMLRRGVDGEFPWEVAFD